MGKNKISLYKRVPRSNVYKVGDPSVINQELIDSVNWPEGDPYCGFIFKRTLLDPSRPLKFRVSKKYAQMLYCFSAGAGIKLPPQPSSAGITSRPPKNLAELVRLSYLEKTRLLRKEGRRAGYSVRNDWEIYKKKFLPKAKALLFFKNGKFLTLAVYFRRKNICGNIENYISWHPKLSGFTQAEVRSVRYQEAAWLRKCGKGRVSGYCITTVDENYRFLASMGFATDRVVFERKDA